MFSLLPPLPPPHHSINPWHCSEPGIGNWTIWTTEVSDEQDSLLPAVKKNDTVCSGEDKWNQKRDENRRKDHYETFIRRFIFRTC